MTLHVAILISGRGSNMAALVTACTQPDFPAEIVCVISNNADAPGLEKAQTAGIATAVVDHQNFEARDDFDAALDEKLRQMGADFICYAGFMRLLGADFIGKWRGRMLNIHPSLLPAYPGLNTHQRVLDDRADITGCTVHFVSEEMDTGPIVTQAQVPVKPGDDAETLAARVLEAEHKLYPWALRKVAEEHG